VRWPSLAVEEALDLVAAFHTKSFQLSLSLDPLSTGAHPETSAETEDRPNYRRRILVAFQLADKGAVDLDLVERKATQAA
jgi:hypothetical protein